MDASQFLDTAKDLLGSAKREGDYRTCISRVYYCVYHTACAAVRKGVAPDLCQRAEMDAKQSISHDKIIRCLKNADDGDVKEVGDELKNLKATRIRADYHLWRTVSKQNALDAVKDAEGQCTTICELTPQRIGKAVTPYLKKIHP